jgi:hypothetical protein
MHIRIIGKRRETPDSGVWSFRLDFCWVISDHDDQPNLSARHHDLRWRAGLLKAAGDTLITITCSGVELTGARVVGQVAVGYGEVAPNYLLLGDPGAAPALNSQRLPGRAAGVYVRVTFVSAQGDRV